MNRIFAFLLLSTVGVSQAQAGQSQSITISAQPRWSAQELAQRMAPIEDRSKFRTVYPQQLAQGLSGKWLSARLVKTDDEIKSGCAAKYDITLIDATDPFEIKVLADANAQAVYFYLTSLGGASYLQTAYMAQAKTLNNYKNNSESGTDLANWLDQHTGTRVLVRPVPKMLVVYPLSADGIPELFFKCPDGE